MASFASSATTCGARKHAWTKIKNSRGKEIVEAKSEVEDTSEIEKDLNLNAIESVPFDEPEAKETEPDEESEDMKPFLDGLLAKFKEEQDEMNRKFLDSRKEIRGGCW